MCRRLLFTTAMLLSVLLGLQLYSQKAEARPPRLNEFLVYTLDGIQAHSSDYQGRTGSGGPIEFVNFNINLSLPAQQNSLMDVPWALLSSQDIDFYRGSVTADRFGMGDGGHLTNLMSPAARLRQVGFKTWDKNNRLDARELEAEMMTFARFVETEFPAYAPAKSVSKPEFVGAGGLSINHFKISSEILSRAQSLTFRGNSREVFVVTVEGVSPINWVGTHIGLEGLGAGQILFYFPNTTEILIHKSGSEMHTRLGLPFSILAPKARLTFNRALITGQVWVRRIESLGFAEAKRDPENPTPEPSGQINYSCFPWVRLGMDCNCHVF